MTERVLSRRELNRALLARQLLLERSWLSAARALEHVAGLQAQDPRAPYVGLWTRLEEFRHEDLTRAIWRRAVVKATLMRATVHLVSARDYTLFLPALLPTLRAYWRRYASTRRRVRGVDQLAARAAAFAAVPRSVAELRDFLGNDLHWWRARFHAPFVHAPVGRDWAFERQPRLVAAEAWLGRPFAPTNDGLAHLVRRYLAAFGPATRADLAAWSGLPVAALRQTLETLDLQVFRDERGRALLDVRRAPLPAADVPAPPRLLAPFDNAILSHADRTRIISDDHRRRVIRAGIVKPAFLVDGFVAGRWGIERGRVRLEPFERLPRRVARDLHLEANRLEAFLR